MSNLLLDDNPLMVLPKLAEKIGLNESIILQQVHYWLKKKLHAKEGYYWTYNSYPEWQKQFPFWSESTIKRTITKLESMNLLIAGNYNKMKVDKTKWYRLNYEELDKYNEKEVFNGREACYDASGQNDPTNVSHCTDEDTNVNRPIPKTSSETSTEILKPIVQNEFERDFDEFYSHYPKKKGKKAGALAYKKARLEDKKKNKPAYTHEQIMNGLFNYKQELQIKGVEEQYMKFPATFLNGEHFNDEFDLTPVRSNNYNQQQPTIWEMEAYNGSQTSQSIDVNGRNDVQKLLQY